MCVCTRASARLYGYTFESEHENFIFLTCARVFTEKSDHKAYRMRKREAYAADGNAHAAWPNPCPLQLHVEGRPAPRSTFVAEVVF